MARSLLVLAALIVVPTALAAPRAAAPDPKAAVEHGLTERARILMGTLCTVGVSGPDRGRQAAAASAFLDEIARLEPALSSWRNDSELMRLNASAADSEFHCSAALYDAVAAALEASRLTGGAFDPTIEPLNRAWDMRGAGRVPSESELGEARALVGFGGVTCRAESRGVRLARRGMGLDLGGIGKGFALERAFDAAGAGCDRALANFGGEILAIGGPHEITIADPRDRLHAALTLDVRNAAVSTSAQAERGVDVGGRHFGHILDPRTGRPCATSASVTVVLPAESGATPPAARADVLSTALLVMGRAAAETFSREHGIAVIWLEPSPGGRGVDAWLWNVTDVRPLPGVAVAFRNHARATEGS